MVTRFCDASIVTFPSSCLQARWALSVSSFISSLFKVDFSAPDGNGLSGSFNFEVSRGVEFDGLFEHFEVAAFAVFYADVILCFDADIAFCLNTDVTGRFDVGVPF